jgi:hypothetical protein
MNPSMMTPSAIADVATKSVSLAGTTYSIRPLGADTFTVLVEGIPVGRIVYTFGTANGVPDGNAITEDMLTQIAEAWFAAIDG